MKNRKVFGIGFHKTGTTSLADALRILGYSVTGPNGAHNIDIANEVEELVFELADKFDAFQDNPWPLFYKELDERYPGSKFILTLRPTDQWIKSLVKHFRDKSTPMREWIYGSQYGSPLGNESVYISRYETHNKDVQEYFSNRPDDLLTFRITEGDGWEKLCAFLGEPTPDQPFPHANTRQQREAASKSSYNPLTRIKTLVSRLTKR